MNVPAKRRAGPAPAAKPSQPVPLLAPAQVEAFFRGLAATIDPKPELHFHSPLELVVAVVLSAQATDRMVNRVTPALFARCPTPRDYLALGEADLCEAIRAIGLYRHKARHILGICRDLETLHGGQVPRTREELQAMPGIGRKTANVILNVLFGEPTLAVDTHVFRVANRVGLVQARTPEATERALLAVVPPQYLPHAHHYLILHGRYTCKARRPECPRCPVAAACNAREKTR